MSAGAVRQAPVVVHSESPRIPAESSSKSADFCPAVRTNHAACMVSVCVGGEDAMCLVDTGSVVSLVSTDFLSRVKSHGSLNTDGGEGKVHVVLLQTVVLSSYEGLF